MKKQNESGFSLSVALLAARLPLGITLLAVGYNAMMYVGIRGFAAQNAGLIPSFAPAWFGTPYLLAIPIAAVVLGALLLGGFFTRVSGLIAGLMLLSFCIGMPGNVINTAISARPGPGSVYLPLAAPLTYLSLTIIVFLLGSGRFSVDALMGRRKAH